MLKNLFEYRKNKNWKKNLKIDFRKFHEENKNLINSEFFHISKDFSPVEIHYPNMENIKELLNNYDEEFLENFYLLKKEKCLRIILPLCSELKHNYEINEKK